jgi:short-subunit dehydrogenase
MGKALAIKFATAGYNIFICARNEAGLREAAADISKHNKNIDVQYFAADLSVKSSAEKFTGWLLSQHIIPDILVNNAGLFLPGNVYNEEEGTLHTMIAANLFSAYYVTRALLPVMMQRKSGHIFNMCSVASLKAYRNGGSYSISKHALMGFSKNLREELKPFNIKVTAIYPGAVFTDSWEGSGIEASRVMEVNDIVDMIYAACLLSPQACVEEIIMRPQLGDIP